MTINKNCDRIKCGWFFVAVIIYAFGVIIGRNEASFIFPDQLEQIEAKHDANFQQLSAKFDQVKSTDVIAATPIEEAFLSEDDAEIILDELGFNSTADENSDIALRFSDGTNTKILRYQQQNGLSETGELDRETIISLKSPKCGVSNVAAHGEDFKWSSSNLTYYVGETPAGIPKATVKQMLKNAFNQWSKVTNLDFVETDDPAADIEIVFGGRKHDNRGSKCKNVLGDTTLAHSYYPQTGGIHFNTKFFPGSMNKDDFFTTAMHEIGHAIGLEHSVSKASLMFHIPVTRFSEVPEPDVEKIQLKYGTREHLESKKISSFCELPKYDSVLYSEYGKLIMVAGKYCYTKFNSKDEPILFSEKWPGAPDSVDAAETVGSQTYVFKGDKVWAFKNANLSLGYPRRIRETFPGLPRNLDAVAYDNRKYIYAFKQGNYWRYNTVDRNVDLSDEIQEDFGVPGRIDAALFSDDKLFLFKDNVRYVHNVGTRKTNRYDSPLFNC